MTIRAYDHLMYAGDTVYSSWGMFENLKKFFIAALVTGTGGEPAAGWTLVYDAGGDTGTYVLGNADGDLFYCFFASSVNVVTVSMATTFEGVGLNGLIIGEAARSGSAGNYTSPMTMIAYRFMGSAGATTRAGWSMLSDGNSVTFCWGSFYNGSYVGPAMDISSTNVYRCGGCICFGKTTKGFGYFAGAGTSSDFTHPSEQVMFINYPDTGLLIPSAEALPDYSAGVAPRSTDYPRYDMDFVYEDILLVPLEIYVYGDATHAACSLGFVRGVYQLPTVDNKYFFRKTLNALGMAGSDFATMRLQDLCKFRVGDDGFRYAMPKLAGTTMKKSQLLITDNPVVW